MAIVVHYWLRADLDLFARVAVGRLVESTGSVAATDPFAFTIKKARWIDHEWLSGVVFYHVSQLGGDRLIFLFKIASMLVTLGLLSAAQRVRASDEGAALPWLLMTLLPATYVWRSTVRAQVFTYICIALFLLVFVLYRRDRRARVLLVLPAAMLFWANAHGGFVVGLGLLGIFAVAAVREGRKFALPLWLALTACVAVTLVNPYGLEYWAYILDAITMERPRIAEWQAISPVSPLGLILLGLLGMFLAGSWRSDHRAPQEAWLMIAVTCFATFRSGRVAAVFVMVLAVYGTDAFGRLVGDIVDRWPDRWAKLRRVGTLAVLLALILFAARVARFGAAFPSFRLDVSYFPVESLEWLLENRSGGDLLVGFNYGSYALWRLYPRFRVSMDGRYEEVYPHSTVDAVRDALDPSSPRHASALEQIDPDFALLPASTSTFAQSEPFGSDWTTIYRDDGFVLLEKAGRAGEPPPHPARRRPMWEPDF